MAKRKGKKAKRGQALDRKAKRLLGTGDRITRAFKGNPRPFDYLAKYETPTATAIREAMRKFD